MRCCATTGVPGRSSTPSSPPGSGGLVRAQGLTFGPDGNLYVSSSVNDQVLRYDGSTGAFLDAFVSQGSGGLDGPEA